MNLTSKKGLIARLRRGENARERFVESHLKKGIAYQLRAIREGLGWNQQQLGDKVHMTQNAISRLESPDYGKHTITTLKRLAAALDVGLIVRFVPFSEMVDWISGTPRLSKGLTTESLAVPSFTVEDLRGAFDGEEDHRQRSASVPIIDDNTLSRQARASGQGELVSFEGLRPQQQKGASALVQQQGYQCEPSDSDKVDFRPLPPKSLRHAQIAGQSS